VRGILGSTQRKCVPHRAPVFETILHLAPHGKRSRITRECTILPLKVKQGFRGGVSKISWIGSVGALGEMGERELRLTFPASGDPYQSPLGASREGTQTGGSANVRLETSDTRRRVIAAPGRRCRATTPAPRSHPRWSTRLPDSPASKCPPIAVMHLPTMMLSQTRTFSEPRSSAPA
jgi:hypothetical protein